MEIRGEREKEESEQIYQKREKWAGFVRRQNGSSSTSGEIGLLYIFFGRPPELFFRRYFLNEHL